MKVSLDTCLKNKTVTNGCSTNHQNDVFGWFVFFGDVTRLRLIGDVIECNIFFCFGDVIGVEQVWWLIINLQKNKVIVLGQISLKQLFPAGPKWWICASGGSIAVLPKTNFVITGMLGLKTRLTTTPNTTWTPTMNPTEVLMQASGTRQANTPSATLA